VVVVSFDTLTEDFIECPNCGFKMVIEYDEEFDGNGDLCCSWWLEKYSE